MTDLDLRHFTGRRDQIVHEACAQQLALVSIGDLLQQSRSDPLSDTAGDLALHDHRVDHYSTVFRDDVAEDLDGAAAWIHLDEARMRGGWVGRLDRVVGHR